MKLRVGHLDAYVWVCVCMCNLCAYRKERYNRNIRQPPTSSSPAFRRMLPVQRKYCVDSLFCVFSSICFNFFHRVVSESSSILLCVLSAPEDANACFNSSWWGQEVNSHDRMFHCLGLPKAALNTDMTVAWNRLFSRHCKQYPHNHKYTIALFRSHLEYLN